MATRPAQVVTVQRSSLLGGRQTSLAGGRLVGAAGRQGAAVCRAASALPGKAEPPAVRGGRRRPLPERQRGRVAHTEAILAAEAVHVAQMALQVRHPAEADAAQPARGGAAVRAPVFAQRGEVVVDPAAESAGDAAQHCRHTRDGTVNTAPLRHTTSAPAAAALSRLENNPLPASNIDAASEQSHRRSIHLLWPGARCFWRLEGTRTAGVQPGLS